MISGKKVVVVMPAYNAEKTLEKTYEALPHDIVDHIIVVDDASRDRTIDVAKNLHGTEVISHTENKG